LATTDQEVSCLTCQHFPTQPIKIEDQPQKCWDCQSFKTLVHWEPKVIDVQTQVREEFYSGLDRAIDADIAAELSPVEYASLHGADAAKVEGSKYDSEKAPMALLDRSWLEETAKVLGFGARKYAAHNWRGGIEYSRLVSAALRHLHAFNDGEDIDPESGLSHLAHASCCLMFLANMKATRPDLDDRY
jgi:hypothetical protein